MIKVVISVSDYKIAQPLKKAKTNYETEWNRMEKRLIFNTISNKIDKRMWKVYILVSWHYDFFTIVFPKSDSKFYISFFILIFIRSGGLKSKKGYIFVMFILTAGMVCKRQSNDKRQKNLCNRMKQNEKTADFRHNIQQDR